MLNNFFSPIRITNRELRSRQLRRYATGLQITGGISIPNPVSNGIRKIDVDQAETDNTIAAQSGPLKGVVSRLKKFFGFAWTAIVRMVRTSFTQLWGTIVQLGLQVWVFDWNQSDQQLRDRIKANNQLILNAAAGALGTTLGWGAVRLVQMGVSKIAGNPGGNQGRDRSLDIRVPIVSGRVAADLAEEGNEEIRGQLQALLMQIKAAQTANMFYGFMLHSRSMEWFGMKSIEKSGTNDSFAQRWKKKIESLPQWLQQPVENFTENFVEAVLEAGFIWASAADDQYALARAAMRDAKGPERTIILQPDERLERDKYIVSGSQEFVIEETERIINTQQLIGKRDIGYWVGEPLEEHIKKQYLSRQLKIRWNTVKEPPLVTPDGTVGAWSECTIPKVRIGLSWQEVKQAADEFVFGGAEGTWQLRYLCFEREEFVGNLIVKGINESECERRVRKLKPLMPASIDLRKPYLTQSSSISPALRTELRRFYPIEATLTIHRNSVEDSERRQRRGRRHTARPNDPYFEDQIKVELWPREKPEDFQGFR